MNIFYLQWHISDNCNNRCRHCYQSIHNSEFDISLDDAIEIANDVYATCKELDVKSIISITGGDPTLHKDFLKIVKIASSKCDQVNIMGNPEKLLDSPESFINSLRESNIHDWQLSLDGLRKTHDHLRYNGSFEKTVHAIQLLKSRQIKVSILSTISSKNINEMPELMKLVYSLGVYSWDFSRWIPSSGDCGVNPNDYRIFLTKINKLHKKYEKVGAPILNKEPLLFALHKKNIKTKSVISSGCGLGSSSLCLLPNKTIMGCRRLPNGELGKWSQSKGFLHYFLFNQQMNFYRELSSYGDCQFCEFVKYCRGCRAAALAATGFIEKRDPQCWINIDRSKQ